MSRMYVNPKFLRIKNGAYAGISSFPNNRVILAFNTNRSKVLRRPGIAAGGYSLKVKTELLLIAICN